jgi:hypothetical protein
MPLKVWRKKSHIRFWYHNLDWMCSLVPQLVKRAPGVPQLAPSEQIGQRPIKSGHVALYFLQKKTPCIFSIANVNLLVYN